MNQMKKMMEKMMSAMVKPEDMPQMMGAMMDRMFSQMSSEDRIDFVSTMMPKCLSLIFAEMDPTAKEKLAREMIGKMASILEGQMKEWTSQPFTRKSGASRPFCSRVNANYMDSPRSSPRFLFEIRIQTAALHSACV